LLRKMMRMKSTGRKIPRRKKMVKAVRNLIRRNPKMKLEISLKARKILEMRKN